MVITIRYLLCDANSDPEATLTQEANERMETDSMTGGKFYNSIISLLPFTFKSKFKSCSIKKEGYTTTYALHYHVH